MYALRRILTFQGNKLNGEVSCNAMFSSSEFDIVDALEALYVLDSANIFRNGSIASFDNDLETEVAQFIGLGSSTCIWSRGSNFCAGIMRIQFGQLGSRIKILDE